MNIRFDQHDQHSLAAMMRADAREIADRAERARIRDQRPYHRAGSDAAAALHKLLLQTMREAGGPVTLQHLVDATGDLTERLRKHMTILRDQGRVTMTYAMPTSTDAHGHNIRRRVAMYALRGGE